MKPFIFVHIYRTGGTTLRYNLIDRYEDIFFYDTSYRLEFKRNRIFKLEKTNTIFEDQDYQDYQIIMGHFTYKKYLHLNRPLVTLLRDPLNRFISNYSNSRIAIKMGFEEFCKRSSNIYIHFTGGDIENFEYIGLTEKYNKSMKHMRKLFGYDFKARVNIEDSTQLNKSKRKKKLNKEQIEYFKELNKDDYKFYNEVLKRNT